MKKVGVLLAVLGVLEVGGVLVAADDHHAGAGDEIFCAWRKGDDGRSEYLIVSNLTSLWLAFLKTTCTRKKDSLNDNGQIELRSGNGEDGKVEVCPGGQGTFGAGLVICGAENDPIKSAVKGAQFPADLENDLDRYCKNSSSVGEATNQAGGWSRWQQWFRDNIAKGIAPSLTIEDNECKQGSKYVEGETCTFHLQVKFDGDSQKIDTFTCNISEVLQRSSVSGASDSKDSVRSANLESLTTVADTRRGAKGQADISGNPGLQRLDPELEAIKNLQPPREGGQIMQQQAREDENLRKKVNDDDLVHKRREERDDLLKGQEEFSRPGQKGRTGPHVNGDGHGNSNRIEHEEGDNLDGRKQQNDGSNMGSEKEKDKTVEGPEEDNKQHAKAEGKQEAQDNQNNADQNNKNLPENKESGEAETQHEGENAQDHATEDTQDGTNNAQGVEPEHIGERTTQSGEIMVEAGKGTNHHEQQDQEVGQNNTEPRFSAPHSSHSPKLKLPFLSLLSIF